MTVKAILSVKGTEVLTIEPTTNLAAAAKLLAERKIGALVVTGPDQRVVGIVSERDIVQELAAHGAAALDLPLTEVMTRKVMTCSASDTISSVMERMTAGKFRHLPVIDRAGSPASCRSATWSSIGCRRWSASSRRCAITSRRA